MQRERNGPPSTRGSEGVQDTAVSEVVRGSYILATHRSRKGAWFALAAIAHDGPRGDGAGAGSRGAR
jgi:hypothetical protein